MNTALCLQLHSSTVWCDHGLNLGLLRNKEPQKNTQINLQFEKSEPEISESG